MKYAFSVEGEGASPEELQKYRSVAEADLETFLLHRAKELINGISNFIMHDMQKVSLVLK